MLCRKEISYSRMSVKERNQLAAELDILKTLRHPNVVQYYSREHLKATSDLHLYMEYCGNGDLGGYIKKLSELGRLADEEFVWAIFAQLVAALYRCHYGEDAPTPGEEGVVRKGKAFQTKAGYRMILHRDLKPENGMSVPVRVECRERREAMTSGSPTASCVISRPMTHGMTANVAFQSSSAKITPSSSVTSGSPRLSPRTTSRAPTWARPSTCRPRSVPQSDTATIPTSGH